MKKVLLLGLIQSNFTVRLYEKIREYHPYLDIYAWNEYKLGDNPSTTSYRQLDISESGKNYLHAISSLLKFELYKIALIILLEYGLKDVYRVIGLLKKWMLKGLYSKVFSDFQICHFHFVKWGNLLEIFFLPKDTKVIVSFWGSDLLRTNSLVDLYVGKRALIGADIITVQSVELKEIILSKFGREFAEKIRIAQFILEKEIFEKIDYWRSEVKTVKKEKTKICIGHNANKANMHVEILNVIKGMPREILNQIELVFIFGYGISDPLEKDIYKNDIVELLNDNYISYSFKDEFLNSNEIAKIRVENDIFIHLPASDALSAAITECMYAGNIVITGNWLPYGPFIRAGLKYYTIDQFNNLGEILAKIIRDKEKVKLDFRTNPEKVNQFFLSDSVAEQWKEIYEDFH
jgi:hypothetical protein